jgi:hypothetical protein
LEQQIKTMHAKPYLPLYLALTAILVAGCSPTPPKTTGTATPLPSSKTPLFRDVSEQVGLRYQWGHQGKTPLTILQTAGGGAGFIDYDNDGKLDIVLIGSTIALFHNEGEKGFREVSASSGLTAQGELMGCAVGDIDGDGFPDLCITGYKTLLIYRNTKGTGRFEDITEKLGIRLATPQDWYSSAGFADLDGDGWLDLVACRYLEFTEKSRQFCEYPDPNGKQISTACPPLYYPGQSLRIFRNRGSGIFEEKTALLPTPHSASLGLSFADYDDDGKLDFYVANDAQPGDLYHNEGGFKFTNEGLKSSTGYNHEGREQAGMGVDWGDYNQDGKLDLIVTTFDNEPKSLYQNNGKGLFSHTSFNVGIGDVTKNRLAFGVAFLDYQNSGFPSILMANGHVQDAIDKIRPPATYAQPLTLFENRSGSQFQQVQSAGEAFQKPIVGRALAVGDYDNDGKLDVLIADLEGHPLLLHNETQEPNSWIGFHLKTAGREAIGARITLTTAQGVRVGESQTCRSYLSATDARIHFGLGNLKEISKVTVRWASGETQTLPLPPLNQYTNIEQNTPQKALNSHKGDASP